MSRVSPAGSTLRVLLVTESREPSGMGQQIRELMRGLQYEVVVAASDGPGAAGLLADAAALGLEVWPLPDTEPEAQADALARLLRRRPVDVVDVQAGAGWEGHQIVRSAAETNIRAIVRTEHLPYLLTDAAQQAAYAADLRYVDAVICVSAGVAASHRAHGVPAAKLRVVRNGISPAPAGHSSAEVRERLGLASADRLAVTVARLTPQKGHFGLLEAVPLVLERLLAARFVWVGQGPLGRSLRAAVEDRGVGDAVHLLDSYDDVPALLAAADVVVVPSRFEGLPLVALEAMAAGRPIVGTVVCGVDEAVDDGVTGRLVPVGKPQQLAEAIVEVLGDPALARRWGEAGRARQAGEFAAERMVAEVAAVYAEVLGGDAARAGSDAADSDAADSDAADVDAALVP